MGLLFYFLILIFNFKAAQYNKIAKYIVGTYKY